MFGQGAVLDAISVGAINANDPGNDTIATYSNQGTSTIYTNFVSQSSTMRNSLDGAGIDAVQTRIGQLGFLSNPFSGTSAAAPHVAAIAALMLEANPHLTPAQAASVLNATAVDIGATGYDNISGFGRFDALAAVQAMPPQVLNVTISSTVSNPYGTNPPFEFTTVDGSQDQLRTVPVGGANRIAVRFSEDVAIAQGDLDYIALNRVVTEPSITGFIEPDIANNFTATWTLAAKLPSAQYLLRLDDTIADLAGNALDGEWTNPGSLNSSVTTSVFPSGNGSPGGDFELVFSYMHGDVDRDLDVDDSDFSIFGGHYGGSSKTWGQGDFTGEGLNNDNDFAIFGGAYNTAVNWRDLSILGDYDDDFDLEADDETDFLAFYNAGNSAADLNGDGSVTVADRDAFYALYNFGIDLEVLP